MELVLSKIFLKLSVLKTLLETNLALLKIFPRMFRLESRNCNNQYLPFLMSSVTFCLTPFLWLNSDPIASSTKLYLCRCYCIMCCCYNTPMLRGHLQKGQIHYCLVSIQLNKLNLKKWKNSSTKASTAYWYKKNSSIKNKFISKSSHRSTLFVEVEQYSWVLVLGFFAKY